MVNWLIKLDSPPFATAGISPTQPEKELRFRGIVRQRRKATMLTTAVAICPKMVAQAAPFMPIPSRKMATGLPMIFTTKPAIIPPVAIPGCPSARTREVEPMEKTFQIIPKEIIRP